MTPLPPRATKVLDDYLRQLEAAGVSPADYDLAKDFMAPDPTGKGEDELILDIKAAWAFVRDVAKRKGAKL